MNSHSDSRSRFWPKYSCRVGRVALLAVVLGRAVLLVVLDRSRLKPVPTGSTNTRSANASQDDSFCTSRGGSSGSVPSAGKSTRCGPTTPRCRNADDAPGPPLKTNITGRSCRRRRRRTRRRRSPRPASRSCAGRASSRAPCSRSALAPPVQVADDLGRGRRLVVRLGGGRLLWRLLVGHYMPIAWYPLSTYSVVPVTFSRASASRYAAARADVLGVDVPVQRRALLDDRLHRREARDRARGERAHRACGDRVHADVLLAEIPREVAHGASSVAFATPITL